MIATSDIWKQRSVQLRQHGVDHILAGLVITQSQRESGKSNKCITPPTAKPWEASYDFNFISIADKKLSGRIFKAILKIISWDPTSDFFIVQFLQIQRIL